MHTHEPQPSSGHVQGRSPQSHPFEPRSFEVTYPGQEIASSPTNPFPRRSHEVWMGEPHVARKPAPANEPDGQAEPEQPVSSVNWHQFSLYPPELPPTQPSTNGIQAKLTVGEPHDAYEQEADRVAEQVMGMPPPTLPHIQRQGEEGNSDSIQPKPLVETITSLKPHEPVQTKCAGCEQEEQIQRSADGIGQTQPNLESRLNTSQGQGRPLSDDVRSFMEPRFGADFSQVRVHTNSEAVQMNRELNAHAFTHRQNIYFGAGKSPGNDALTAHELTHVVQQTGVIQSSKSSSQLPMQQECSDCKKGEEVQRFQSPLQMNQNLKLNFAQDSTVQRLGQSLKIKPAVKPAHGTTDDKKQRQYSVEQYIAMWEAEQGRKLTDDEKATIARGCIGITALNLEGDGDPPLDDCYGTFEQAKASMDKRNEALALARDVALSLGLTDLYNSYKNQQAVLFAKLFWSNQNSDETKRKKPNKKAFLPNKKTGKVDMTGYNYLERPGFINFDYGFWDEASQSFWHANHRQPGMKVYQSTKEKFAKGYIDFDRIIYCVAIAKNYDPTKAVKSP